MDCRLIASESKFKFVEGLDSEAGFDFYNISFSPFYGTGLLIKNISDKFLALFLFSGLSLSITFIDLMIQMSKNLPLITSCVVGCALLLQQYLIK